VHTEQDAAGSVELLHSGRALPRAAEMSYGSIAVEDNAEDQPTDQ